MDPSHVDILRVNRSKLVKSIGDIKSVVEELYEMKTITAHMKEELIEMPIKSKTDQTRGLLDLLPKRPPSAFEEFVAALISCEEWGAVEILKGCRSSTQDVTPVHTGVPVSQSTIASSEEEEEEELPQVWPDINYKPLEVKVKKVHTQSMKRKFDDCSKPKSQIYSIQKKIKGKVLIINNEKFSDTKADRDATDVDAASLDKLFQKLNFKVESVDNQTAKDIRTTLTNASKEDYSAHDCFICFFLSHGRAGEIYGTDGETVNIKEMIDLFNSQNCRSLSTKPKLFFVQACQGKTADTGSKGSRAPSQQVSSKKRDVNVKDAETVSDALGERGQSKEGIEGLGERLTDVNLEGMETALDAMDEIAQCEKEIEDILNWLRDGNLKDTDTVSDAIGQQGRSDGSRNIPTRADTFVAFATTPDYLSYRNDRRGAWFIQTITYVFQRYACVNDINQLMIKVNHLLSLAEQRGTKHKQISKFESTFTKEFYFFPGLVSDPGPYNQLQPTS